MAAQQVGAQTLYIEPGSPWENGYCEIFKGTLRDELLNGEIFYSLKEARIVIERWRREYNEVRPHSSLGYRPPAPPACSPKALILAQPQMLQSTDCGPGTKNRSAYGRRRSTTRPPLVLQKDSENSGRLNLQESLPQLAMPD